MKKIVYQTWDDVPSHLFTKTHLSRSGKKPAPGQPVEGYKRNYYRGSDYELYDIDKAIDKKPATKAQLAAIEKARAQAELNSRCAQCGADFDYLDRSRIPIEDTGNGAYICFICRDRIKASAWARQVLETPGALILDTETTGLGDDDQIVEISIINIAGETVFDSLVKPTISIPYAATKIHGISNADVANAPTWAEIDDQVFELLRSAPAIVIYNRDYDLQMLYQSRAAHDLPDHDREQVWLIDGKPKSRCAMKIYAIWYGEWNDHHGNYRWQKLNGGHRALGDCLATLEKIKEMAGVS